MMFLGVDTGGTKTHALVSDESGRVMGAGCAGSGNWETIGLEGMYEALDRAVNETLIQAGAGPATWRGRHPVHSQVGGRTCRERC